MTFENNLWHLPVYATVQSAGRTKLQPESVTPVRTGTISVTNDSRNTNRFFTLSGVTAEPTYKAPKHRKPSGWTEEDIAEDHQAWCHPGPSKRVEILSHYPSLFPQDPTICKEIVEFRCPACDLCKGARTYCKTKAQKWKEQKAHAKQRSPKTSVETSAYVDEPAVENAAACAARQNKTRVQFAAEQSEATFDRWYSRKVEPLHFLTEQVPSALSAAITAVPFAPAYYHCVVAARNPTKLARNRDDFLCAFTALRDLHIDYAHTIAVGFKNEQYYLIILVDGVDFLWASPTKTKSGPEELLEEFLQYTRIKVGKLQCDFDSMMAKSANFQM
eukprot:2497576-Rhodomonas_salina.3